MHGHTAGPYCRAIMQGHTAWPSCKVILQDHTALPSCKVILQGHHARSYCRAILHGHHAGPYCRALLCGFHAGSYCRTGHTCWAILQDRYTWPSCRTICVKFCFVENLHKLSTEHLFSFTEALYYLYRGGGDGARQINTHYTCAHGLLHGRILSAHSVMWSGPPLTSSGRMRAMQTRACVASAAHTYHCLSPHPALTDT